MDTIKQFWDEVEKLLVNNEPKIFYRLYYDTDGNPLYYSMEDLPGNYIELDKETYALADSKVKVKNGKLYKLNLNDTVKLVPYTTSGFLCHMNDVTVITNIVNDGVFWNLKTYDNYD